MASSSCEDFFNITNYMKCILIYYNVDINKFVINSFRNLENSNGDLDKFMNDITDLIVFNVKFYDQINKINKDSSRKRITPNVNYNLIINQNITTIESISNTLVNKLQKTYQFCLEKIRDNQNTLQIPIYITRNFIQFYVKCLTNLISNSVDDHIETLSIFYLSLFKKILSIITDDECIQFDNTSNLDYHNSSLILFLQIYRKILDDEIDKMNSNIISNTILVLNDFKEMNTTTKSLPSNYFMNDTEFTADVKTFGNVNTNHEFLMKDNDRFFRYANGSYQIDFEKIEKKMNINRNDYSFFNMNSDVSIIDSLQIDELLNVDSIFFTIGYSGVGKTRLMLGNDSNGLLSDLVSRLDNYTISKLEYKEIYGYDIFDSINSDKHLQMITNKKRSSSLQDLTNNNLTDKLKELDTLQKNRFVIPTINNPESSRSIIIYTLDIQNNNTNDNRSIILVDIPGSESKLSMYDTYLEIVYELNNECKFDFDKNIYTDSEGRRDLCEKYKTLKDTKSSLYEFYKNFELKINHDRDFMLTLQDIGAILRLKMHSENLTEIKSNESILKLEGNTITFQLFYQYFPNINRVKTSGLITRNFFSTKLKFPINTTSFTNLLFDKKLPLDVTTALKLECKNICAHFIENNTFKSQTKYDIDLTEYKNLYYSNYAIIKEMYTETTDSAQEYFNKNVVKLFTNEAGLSLEKEFRIFFQGKFINKNIQNISNALKNINSLREIKSKDICYNQYETNVFRILDEYIFLTEKQICNYKYWNIFSINSNINSNKKLLSNALKDIEYEKHGSTLNYERTLIKTQVDTLKNIFN